MSSLDKLTEAAVSADAYVADAAALLMGSTSAASDANTTPQPQTQTQPPQQSPQPQPQQQQRQTVLDADRYDEGEDSEEESEAPSTEIDLKSEPDAADTSTSSSRSKSTPRSKLAVDKQIELLIPTDAVGKVRDFYNDLFHFMWRTSKKLPDKLPVMGFKPLDLYSIYDDITGLGGFDKVSFSEGVWSKIFKKSQNFRPTITNAGVRLRKYYKKFLYDYEKANFDPINMVHNTGDRFFSNNNKNENGSANGHSHAEGQYDEHDVALHNVPKPTIIFSFGSELEVCAELYDTETAKAFANILPIVDTSVETFGNLFYFTLDTTKLEVPKEADAKEILEKGEIVYWIEKPSILCGYGPTPMSRGEEIRLLTKCNVLGRVISNLDDLSKISEDMRVSVKLVPPPPPPAPPVTSPVPSKKRPHNSLSEEGSTALASAPGTSSTPPSSNNNNNNNNRKSHSMSTSNKKKKPATPVVLDDDDDDDAFGAATEPSTITTRKKGSASASSSASNTSASSAAKVTHEVTIKYKYEGERETHAKLIKREIVSEASAQPYVTMADLQQFLSEDNVAVNQIEEIRYYEYNESDEDGEGWVLLHDDYRCPLPRDPKKTTRIRLQLKPKDRTVVGGVIPQLHQSLYNMLMQLYQHSSSSSSNSNNSQNLATASNGTVNGNNNNSNNNNSIH